MNQYATRPVPRYTSYPTAPHFSPDVTGDDYRAWLSALPTDAPVSLYLHVPFCREVCWYCGCHMKLARRDAPLEAYADTLLREISLVRDALPGRLTVSHLHWGGGTPTALSPAALARIMEALRQAFTVQRGAELAIESDPRTLTPQMARLIGDLGFTRASFGVQEFDPRVQAAINRIQPPTMVATAVGRLRKAGVRAINFDLIYGLPHQTVATLVETVDHCETMTPDRVALFGYAHVPWMAKRQRMIDEAALPKATEREAQSLAAAQLLESYGHVPIGLDHFARPGDPLAVAAGAGTLRRNFQGYTTDDAQTLISFGASAIGKTPAGYVQSLQDVARWRDAVHAGALPVARGHAFGGEDRLRADVIEAIMCHNTVDVAAICAQHHAAGALDEALGSLTDLVADGLLTQTGATLCLTQKGQTLRRVVAAAFDAYLPNSAARHSIAV